MQPLASTVELLSQSHCSPFWRSNNLGSQMIDPEVLYRTSTPSSRALHERAVKVMPGGTTRTTTYFDPYPLYIERGEGCRIWDADGSERIRQ